MDWGCAALAWGWFAVVLLRLRVKPLADEAGRARLPRRWMAGLMVLCGVMAAFFTAMTAACLSRRLDAGVFPVMALLCALDAGFAGLPCIRWNAEGLAVRGLLGRTRRIPWTEVHGWYRDGGNLWLKTARGRILLPSVMRGQEALPDYARAHIPTADESPLPLIPDVFHGHVQHPARLLATLAVCALVGAGMAGQGAYLLCTANASADNT